MNALIKQNKNSWAVIFRFLPLGERREYTHFFTYSEAFTFASFFINVMIGARK